MTDLIGDSSDNAVPPAASEAGGPPPEAADAVRAEAHDVNLPLDPALTGITAGKPTDVAPAAEETPFMPPPWSVIEAQARKARDALHPALVQKNPPTAESRLRRASPEHIERIRSLQFGELKFDPNLPPEQALKEIGELYSTNLVPDEAFHYLASGETAKFLETAKEGMLNRFHPLPEEFACYPEGYVSVRDQMHRDLCSENCAGDYRIFGLRDPEGKLRTWGSFRLPSEDPERMRRYREHLDATLFNPELVTLDKGDIRQRLAKANYQLIEFDTENSTKGYEYAGTLLLLRALRQIRKERGDKMPPGLFFYHFGALKPISPRPSGVEEDFHIDAGVNTTTARLATDWGCGNIGYRQDPNEVVVRMVSNFSFGQRKGPLPVIAGPTWRYSSQKTTLIEEVCENRLIQRGILAEDE